VVSISVLERQREQIGDIVFLNIVILNYGELPAGANYKPLLCSMILKNVIGFSTLQFCNVAGKLNHPPSPGTASPFSNNDAP
jgi:hypothetical protein